MADADGPWYAVGTPSVRELVRCLPWSITYTITTHQPAYPLTSPPLGLLQRTAALPPPPPPELSPRATAGCHVLFGILYVLEDLAMPCQAPPAYESPQRAMLWRRRRRRQRKKKKKNNINT